VVLADGSIPKVRFTWVTSRMIKPKAKVPTPRQMERTMTESGLMISNTALGKKYLPEAQNMLASTKTVRRKVPELSSFRTDRDMKEK